MEYIYAAMAVMSFLGALGGGNQRYYGPDLPSYIPPDYGPINEQTETTEWQDNLRNQLMTEYYGGDMTGYAGRPNLTGTVQSDRYMDEQMKIVNDSEKEFPADLSQYYLDRGMESGDQVAGAQAELGNLYDQRKLDINSKAQDIYALTLGQILGEVGPVGNQAGQMTGLAAQASQMENQRRDQAYQTAMQRYAQSQQQYAQPTVWDALGSTLPYVGMLVGSASGTPNANAYQSSAQPWLDAYAPYTGGAGFNPSTTGPNQYYTGYFKQ